MNRPDLIAEDADVRAFLRPPAVVMRLARMGAFFPTRLSFMRTLVRRMTRERWRFALVRSELDQNGYGRMVWRITTPERTLSFVAFSTALSADERTDRVIAEKWDASFALVDGEVGADDVARLEANVPRQEAGRLAAKDLVLSRANRSVRLFEHVSERLAAGRQPEPEEIAKVGYLMRTTAVYGNGKFGMGDYDKLKRTGAFDSPFRAEMLTVYMIRQFQFDLVDHVAAMRGGNGAARLAPDLCRSLGIGNATGLGMAPFLIRHPVLLDAWMRGRETALARVRAERVAGPGKCAGLKELLERARRHAGQWNVEEPRQEARIVRLRSEIEALARFEPPAAFPWDALYRHAEEKMSLEAQELVVAVLIEMHGELVDDLEAHMRSDAEVPIDAAMSLEALKGEIERHYDWALAIDYGSPEARHYFWYYSEGKEEPRLGRRFAEPGAEREMRLGSGFHVKSLHDELARLGAEELKESVARFLLRRPEHRLAVQRVATTMKRPYAEIRDNTLGAGLLPIDMLRCKLSFFGATRFDPKSDLWTRITMYQGAPLIGDLAEPWADDWWLPVVEAASTA
jgi:hypothetical protein